MTVWRCAADRGCLGRFVQWDGRLIECVHRGGNEWRLGEVAGAVRWFDTATTSIFMGEVNEQALWY